jgi:hypothetical protein
LLLLLLVVGCSFVLSQGRAPHGLQRPVAPTPKTCLLQHGLHDSRHGAMAIPKRLAE